jgi:hypothetical protein
VYYLSYPCEKLNAWWVVHKVNLYEWLHTLGDAGYHNFFHFVYFFANIVLTTYSLKHDVEMLG